MVYHSLRCLYAQEHITDVHLAVDLLPHVINLVTSFPSQFTAEYGVDPSVYCVHDIRPEVKFRLFYLLPILIIVKCAFCNLDLKPIFIITHQKPH